MPTDKFQVGKRPHGLGVRETNVVDIGVKPTAGPAAVIVRSGTQERPAYMTGVARKGTQGADLASCSTRAMGHVDTEREVQRPYPLGHMSAGLQAPSSPAKLEGSTFISRAPKCGLVSVIEKAERRPNPQPHAQAGHQQPVPLAMLVESAFIFKKRKCGRATVVA